MDYPTPKGCDIGNSRSSNPKASETSSAGCHPEGALEGASPAFPVDTVFLLHTVIPVEPNLALYSGARAQLLLQSLQKLGLEIRK